MIRTLLICVSLFAATAAATAGPKAVIELFTSQGCASCPPADALLGRLAKEEDVIAVSMPVTIWDYLGWPDTLALPDLTRRQIAYSESRGDREVYTPQVIVSGREAVVGSDRSSIEAVIRDQNAAKPALPLPVDIVQRGGVLVVEIGAADGLDADRATVWLLHIARELSVPIGRGENRGRNITYHNVVREMRPIGVWKGRPKVIEIPLSDVEQDPNAGCIVIVQPDAPEGPGPILGAAQLEYLFGARDATVSRAVAPIPADD